MLDLYRHLVVTGAWWDHVDEVAAHLVGGVLAGHRTVVTPVMRAWARDDDLWVRRTAVLSQLRHGADTDTALLHDVIEANLDDRSFWLRKAIGWALREVLLDEPGVGAGRGRPAGGAAVRAVPTRGDPAAARRLGWTGGNRRPAGRAGLLPRDRTC